jgi:mRNA deadenylase 3'-5' endonuclease subunit Ccr4
MFELAAPASISTSMVDMNELARALHLQRFERNNIGSYVILRALNGDHRGKCVLVANCHLFWNPLHAGIKLSQSVYFVHHIQRAAAMAAHLFISPNNVSSSPPPPLPVVIAGYTTHLNVIE